MCVKSSSFQTTFYSPRHLDNQAPFTRVFACLEAIFSVLIGAWCISLASLSQQPVEDPLALVHCRRRPPHPPLFLDIHERSQGFDTRLPRQNRELDGCKISQTQKRNQNPFQSIVKNQNHPCLPNQTKNHALVGCTIRHPSPTNRKLVVPPPSFRLPNCYYNKPKCNKRGTIASLVHLHFTHVLVIKLLL